jgi:hypothetical protein
LTVLNHVQSAAEPRASSKTSTTVLKTIEEHIETSTNHSEGIIASVDSTAEKLDDLVVRIHDQYAEVKGWYSENFGRLEDIADEITTWKDDNRIKKDRSYPLFR